jgi:hypothetical protein
MMRRSPDTTSKRTELPLSGTAAWASVAVTIASPPEQTEVPHAGDWLGLGVTATVLLMVRGLTVNVAVAGVVAPVSRTVRVIEVSAATWPGTTVIAEPAKLPMTGTTAWLLDVMKYEPFPPVIRKIVGRSEYSMAVEGVIVIGPGVTTVGSETAPLPHEVTPARARKASAKRAMRSKTRRVTRIPEWREVPRFY